MIKQSILGLTPATQFNSILDLIDSRLYILGTGNPNGVVGTDVVGRMFFDQSANIYYKCTACDGTISGTTWVSLVGDLGPATDTSYGTIKIATDADVVTGTDAFKAVTPFTLNSRYLSKADNLSSLTSASAARTNLNLGSIAVQNSNSVSISGGLLNGITIGGTVRGDGSFNNLYSYGSTAIRTASGVARTILAQNTAGLLRWSFGASSTTESGSNVGADYVIYRYDDTGAYLGNPLLINRATGAWTINGDWSFGGSFTFSGASRRLRGDMSNTTQSNRLLFQTSTANSNTGLGILPSGSGTTSSFKAYGGSDPDNCAVGTITITPASVQISSGIYGTGSYTPLQFLCGGDIRVNLAVDGQTTINQMATQIISTDTTAVPGTTYVATSNLTLTLPSAPPMGSWFGFVNLSGTLTCVIDVGGANIRGVASGNINVDNLTAVIGLRYAGATTGYVLA